MKVTYRQASRDDVARQSRYYLIDFGLPDVALRFREAVRKTVTVIKQQPRMSPIYSLQNPRLKMLRSWPVMDFEAIRICFLLGDNTVQIVRVLHGKRDIRSILKRE